MAELPVNVGSTANDPAADPIRTAFQSVNANIAELYDAMGINAATFGTFTGALLTDSQTAKQLFQIIETSLEAVHTLSGRVTGSTHLSTFTGATIADNVTIKAALQALETALEADVVNVTALVTLSGVAAAAAHLGTFTGTTIADSVTVKAALQALETAHEVTAALVTSVVNAAGVLKEGVQSLTGAGAVNLTTGVTAFTSSGVAQALTLADGASGQIKRVVHIVDGGSAVLTPANFGNGTIITFTNVGESVTLQFLGTKWFVIALNGAVVS